MRRGWFWFRRMAGIHRRSLRSGFAILFLVLFAAAGRRSLGNLAESLIEQYGVQTAGRILKQACPVLSADPEEELKGVRMRLESPLEIFLSEEEEEDFRKDPAYEKILAEAGEDKAFRGQNGMEPPVKTGNGETETGTGASDGGAGENAGQEEARGDTAKAAVPGTSREVISEKQAGQTLILEKLADYDYLMKNFYSVHPTTTAGRDVMNAEKFLSMDFSLEKNGEEPQILIYHTHSQEEFSDYPENPDATIVGVGAYLAELLEKKGYRVIHDESVYDLRDGKLDRSQAYTYALDGITGILQEHPSIEVVLDIHRDGVGEDVHLVQDINGKPTAQIMFFNGMSQTPDGPIEYLPNPNRDSNLGFSFQLQLEAAGRYPGFTRKIYLKGLRYNEHVRARSALIEVGAQTNTYEEARNAMEPLAELLELVLSGDT